MHAGDDLFRARDSYARGDWHASYDLFTRAQTTATLATDDLSALGVAAWRLGRGKESIRIAEQVFHHLVSEADTAKAATKAVELGLQWINCGDLTLARGWMTRARRLLETLPEGPTHGYLMYLDAFSAIFDGDYHDAARRAEQLQEFGRRLDSPALTSLGLTVGGLAAICNARTSEAFAQLDEAMLPVLADQVPLDWAGDIYCSVIHYCHRVADLARMRAWTTAMERWCAGPAATASAYGGVCDVHKLQLLSATEDFGEVERQLMGTSAALQDVNLWAAAEGYYELGEVRRRKGDRAGARGAFAKARELGCDPQPGEALLRCQLGEHAAAWTELRVRLEAEDDLGRVRMLRAAVDIALARDCVDEADEYCRRLQESAELFDTAGFRAWASHARGAVLVKQGRPTDALPVLQDALRRYRNLKCRYETAQVYEWISLAHEAAGHPGMAAADAATAESIYRQLGAEPNQVCGSAAQPGGLTKREIEVLTGIASGATNREVAGQLFISEKTVGRHLANIYAKIDVSSRTAAVAWAHEHNVLHSG